MGEVDGNSAGKGTCADPLRSLATVIDGPGSGVHRRKKTWLKKGSGELNPSRNDGTCIASLFDFLYSKLPLKFSIHQIELGCLVQTGNMEGRKVKG